jgi:hypothetical protein
MARVAGFIAEALRDERPRVDIAGDVAGFVGSLGPFRFTWPS